MSSFAFSCKILPRSTEIVWNNLYNRVGLDAAFIVSEENVSEVGHRYKDIRIQSRSI
jgi:hypothetical protein